MKTQAKIVITGLVQGVNFRYDTKRKAEKLGLVGYIKNLSTENQVEIVIQGNEENINELTKWCKSGTVYSRIKKVEVEYEKTTGEYHEFKIEY